MFSISERKVDYYLDRFLHPSQITDNDTGPRGFIGVIGNTGALEGAIMVSIGQPWYSEDWSLDEFLNHVDPAHRNSHHSKALIGYAKHMVDQLLPSYPTLRLVIGILSVKRTAAKIRHYAQVLQQPCGAFFSYPPLPNADGEALKLLYKNKGH